MGARIHWDEGRKKWFVRVYDGGRQYKRYVGRDRGEAQAVADVINADLDRVSEYSHVVFSPRRPVNGEDGLRWWLTNYRFKRSTHDLNRGRIENHLIPYFGRMDLRNLRALDVRQYADSRFATGCSAHSVKGEVSILRRVLNSLVENGALERNPVPRIMASVAESARAHPDPNRAESREAWTPEEAWCLLEFAKRHEPQWYPILMFYFQTGARLGEGLALRWDSVDIFGRDIHIRRAVAAGEEGEPKWGKQRHVPISDELLEVLKWLARKRRISEPWKSPELVFLSPRGKQILKRVLQRAWERIRSRAHADHGVRPLSLHSFRHTWVTMMLRDGQDPQWVAATVGDSLDVIYKHYSHVLPSRHRDLTALTRAPISPEANALRPLRAG